MPPPISQLNRPARRNRRPRAEALEDRSLLATVSIGPAGLHVAEGASATLQATISQPQMGPVTVNYRTIGGTAIENTDYTGIASGSVTIPPMATFANISVAALNDILLESGETFSVELTGASGATVNPSASSVEVTIDNVQSGGGGGSGGSLTVSLSLPSDVEEGQPFTMTGTINATGSYQVSGAVDWGITAGEGTTTFSVTTSPSGTFTISHRYVDDGPDPGNGTPQDLQAITVTGTATPMFPGGETLTVSGSTSTTIHNVAPTPVFDVYNYMPLGGPVWVAAGTYQDVGLTDKGTLTIDWGDGSTPYTGTGIAVGSQFSQMHRYPPEGLSYTITMTITDDDTGSVSYSEGFPLYLLDLDNDANNNGEISVLDESSEPPASGPGRYISVNADDDDENGVADMFNTGSVAAENDLEPFEVKWARAIRPEINDYQGWKVKLQISPYDVDMANNYPGIPNLNPHVYTTADKSSEIMLVSESPYLTKIWTVNETVPSLLYLEARRTGPISIRLALYTPPGVEQVEVDEVFFTALAADTDVNLEIYHGQGGKVVSMADEETKGAVTVANRNDTDGDNDSIGASIPDAEDNQVLETDGYLSPNGIRRGLNEKDLMRLDVHKPTGYVAGTPVTLTLSNPDRMKLWKKSTKEIAIITNEGDVVIDDWAANDWTTNATTGTKTIWVEITSKSTACSDLSITLKYGAKTDVVTATGVWVERTVVAFEDANFIRDFELWPEPWKNAPTDIKEIIDRTSGGPQGNAIGTGVRAKFTNGDGLTEFSNNILFEFQVFPANAQEYFKDVVRFDVTRQLEMKKWAVTVGGAITKLEEVKLPDKWEAANDDSPTGPGTTPLTFSDESIEPDATGKMYSCDGPGHKQLPLLYPVGTTIFGRWSCYEYVRVALNGTKPNNDGLLGSQCSPSYAWHSRITLTKAPGGDWDRENDAATQKINDIGSGTITIGDAP